MYLVTEYIKDISYTLYLGDSLQIALDKACNSNNIVELFQIKDYNFIQIN